MNDTRISLDPAIEWRISPDQVPYREALAAQEARNQALASGEDVRELVWLLEFCVHMLKAFGFDVVETGRGGRYTYHGPGQRVCYVLLDLKQRAKDVRQFVHSLEHWVIATLADFGVEAFAVPDRIGIWTHEADGSEAKIGAIGVRVRRWVTMHGFAVNLSPDLSHFGGIVPCGIAEYGVTSMERLGKTVAPAEWDEALLARAGDFLAAIADPEGQ